MFGKIIMVLLLVVVCGDLNCFAQDKVVVIPLVSEGSISHRNTNLAKESPLVADFIDHGIYIEDKITGLQWIQEDDNTPKNWNQAMSYCSNLNVFGVGWRLPSKGELISIADYTLPNSAINSSIFPGTNIDNYYWTATNSARNSENAWMVWFGDGSHLPFPKSNSLYVRCVRGYPSTGNFKLNDNGTVSDPSDDTVTDFSSGLIWQRFGEGYPNTWNEAITVCQNLNHGGFSDWRLPNIKELDSITDPRVSPLSINNFVFSGTQSERYWSSTTLAIDVNYAYFVHFADGYIDKRPKSESLYIRCVRGPDK